MFTVVSISKLSVGDNVSRVVVDPYDYPDYDVVQRGQKLYDRKNNTYVFTENLKADVTITLFVLDVPVLLCTVCFSILAFSDQNTSTFAFVELSVAFAAALDDVILGISCPFVKAVPPIVALS